MKTKSMFLFILLFCCTSWAWPVFYDKDEKAVQYKAYEFVKYKDGMLYIFADGNTEVFRQWSVFRLSSTYRNLFLLMDIDEYDKDLFEKTRKVVRIHKSAQIIAFDDNGILLSRNCTDEKLVTIPWDFLSRELHIYFGKTSGTWRYSGRARSPKYLNDYTDEWLMRARYMRWYLRNGKIPVKNSFSTGEREREAHEKKMKEQGNRKN